MDPKMMAGGGGVPPQEGMTTVTPENTMNTDVDAIIESLKNVVSQSVDDQGYVDMNRLMQMWPQFSQVPFETLLEILDQNPELFENIVAQYGLNGITIDGRTMSLDDLHNLGGAM